MSTPSPTETAAFDRGATPYFHGRKQILANFDKLVKDSMDTQTGSIFLIQGAPGVGKTALLDVLSKRAKGRGWRIAEIDPPALWDPEELSYYLGKGTRAQITSVSGQVGVDAVVKAEGKLDVAVQRHDPKTLKILAAGKRPLLLILDEAQTLGTTNKPPSQELAGVTTNVLNSIHNGRLKRPVILLAAGLGTTIEAFGALGISRFAEGCVVELGALSKESERAVIQDWLVKEGGAKGDPAPWIDAIAQQTHGWPRHVHSYAKHAAGHLKEKGGIMTSQGLKIVMELGEEGCKQYYKQRISNFRGDQLQCLMKSMGDADKGKTARYKVIMSSMVDEYGREEPDNLFHLFIEKGILEEHEEGYAISIPSMHTWLNEKYGLERLGSTHGTKAHPTPMKNFGLER